MQQYVRVSRDVEWEMAHLLKGHPGKCRFVHGHSYKLNVEVGGKIEKSGMVIDFGELKTILQEQIVKKFDHSFVIDRETYQELPEKFTEKYCNTIVLEFPPTSENLLLLIREKILTHLPGTITLESLTLQETSGSKARWLRTDN